MDAALEFTPAPAAGAQIIFIERFGRAGLAADAGIAFVVKREHRYLTLARVLPDFFVRPGRERTYLEQLFTGRERETIHRLQIRTGWGLYAAQSGEPDFIPLQCGKKRADFAQSAAFVRPRLVEQSVLRFLLGNRLPGDDIDQIQTVARLHFIAITVDLGEVVPGFEEKHGHIG